MEVTVEARNFKARESLREDSIKEVNRLEKFFPRIISAHVVLSGRQENKEATVRIKVPENVLVASETADRFEVAVEAAVDKLRHQLEKYKEKLRKR